MSIAVLYHSGCLDGFGAAFAAYHVFGADAVYLPVSYGEEPPKLEPYSDVFILDFSYPKEQLHALARQHRQVLVIDHHKTAKEALAGFPGIYSHTITPTENIAVHFDMERSGAALAWSHFCGDRSSRMIEAIEDRDLWRFNLEHTKEINSFLFNAPRDFKVWEQIDGSLLSKGSTAYQSVINTGKAFITRDENLVQDASKLAYKTELSGYPVMAINFGPILASEMGHYLVQQHPDCYAAVMWHKKAPGVYIYSLRSEGDKDVTLIVKPFGGGGHKNAAGFQSGEVLV